MTHRVKSHCVTTQLLGPVFVTFTMFLFFSHAKINTKPLRTDDRETQ